jgi:hypothetical protein
MKHLMFVCLFFFFAVGMNRQGISQEDQGGGLGVGFRGLRGGAMYPHRTNSATIKKHRRIENARILAGVRRLVSQDYPTIQAAIDSSVDGDTVLVSDGTYLENIRFRGKAIVVTSLFLIDGDTSHIEQTIIDGSNPSNPDSASVVYFIDGEDTTSVLCGFTITGGAGTLWTSSTQDMWRLGGGVYCDSSVHGATIMNNYIHHNRVSGDFAASGGVDFTGDQGFLILDRNRISNNHVSASLGYGRGGGTSIEANGVYVRIVGNIFEQDTVVSQGFAVSGAIDLIGTELLADGLIQGNVFRENIVDATTQGGLGGAVGMGGTGPVIISENLFEDNIAKSKDAWAEGGALILEDTDVPQQGRKSIVGNRFVNNLSSSQFYDGRGGAIELFNTLATVSGNYFEQNTAQGGTAVGGAIRIYASAFRLEDNICYENTALYGGAVHVSNASSIGTDKGIINNTIVNNHASIGGGGIYIGGGVQPSVANSILWGNTPNQIALSGGSILVGYSDIQGGYSGTGNINANPYFANADDYQLSDSSLCIGAGIDSIQLGGVWYQAPPTDIAGNPRPNPPGSMPDMGAQENPLSLPEQYILVPQYFSTIQAGINAASDGEIVIVDDGTYMENINFKGKAITVASYYILDGDTNHINNTIIDGSQPSNPDSGSVVYFVSGEDTNSILSGFIITGGTGTQVTPLIKETARGGGGILCINSDARITHNRIINNSVNDPLSLEG